MEHSKRIVLLALTADKKFKFVESEKEVDAYYNQQTYAIKKDSTILKELVNELDTPVIKKLIEENKFPLDVRFLPLRKGYYHIIDVYEKEIEIKSQIKTQHIAYALHRETEVGDFFNKIYQIRLNPLKYNISRRLFSEDNNLSNLVGKTICVFESEKDKEKGYLKVTWEGVEEIEIHIKEEEYENFLIDQMYEEEAQEEQMLENFLIDQEMLRIAEEEAMYEASLIEAEIERIALEEAEIEASMIDYIDVNDEDVSFDEMSFEEEI